MANIARVRVELRKNRPLVTKEDHDRAFKTMFATFKKVVIDCGILHDYKQHEFFEGKSEKKRRKKREADLERFKAKLRNNFIQ